MEGSGGRNKGPRGEGVKKNPEEPFAVVVVAAAVVTLEDDAVEEVEEGEGEAEGEAPPPPLGAPSGGGSGPMLTLWRDEAEEGERAADKGLPLVTGKENPTGSEKCL
jgi:hypothetical protein